jgi:hypothetical protein
LESSLKIAVLGWGSLIWNPDQLDIEPDWHEDGPELPVEFARVSGRERLTLVLVDGVPLQRTLWALSRKTNLAEAVADLQLREGAAYDTYIGRWSMAQPAYSRGVNIIPAISAWAIKHGLDGVVWTALGPKKPNGENGLASSDERIDYLRGLIARGKEADAQEYIERAPTQIDTPIRRRIREELGWL